MDLQTLSFLHDVFQKVQRQEDWKAALDVLFVSLRDSFVFDNVAIYLEDPQIKGLEVVYARAVGRGKTAEADAVWGESIATEAIATGKMVLKLPIRGSGQTDRLGLPVVYRFEIWRRIGFCPFWRTGVYRTAYSNCVLAGILVCGVDRAPRSARGAH
jgi:hypothetical protein